MTWTDDHGDYGMRRKFDVYKPRDAHHDTDLSGNIVTYLPEDRIGADGEFIFVLRPETDRAAWAALIDYADNVERRAPQLAADIHCELRRIRVANDESTP